MQKPLLAVYLSQKREAAGLSIAELAERLGNQPDQIEAWESGVETPPGSLLAALITTLEIDELDLVGILTQDSMERWQSVLLTLTGNKSRSG